MKGEKGVGFLGALSLEGYEGEEGSLAGVFCVWLLIPAGGSSSG